MAITYRGVSQEDIAQSIEALALRLIDMNIGPKMEESALFWLSQDGPAQKIRTAQTKADIEAALFLAPPKADYDMTGLLGKMFGSLLPNVFTKAERGLQISLAHEIGSVAAWNGFSDHRGCFSVLNGTLNEMYRYCEEKYNVEPWAHTFNPKAFRGAYDTFKIYDVPGAAGLTQQIADLAQAQDRTDELGGVDENARMLYATSGFAREALNTIADIQALSIGGVVLNKAPVPSKAQPKPAKTPKQPKP